MPLPSLDYITPYEKLFGVNLDIQQLMVFGCLCYSSTLKQGRTKFDSRADPCVFLGYSLSQKAIKFIISLHTNI